MRLKNLAQYEIGKKSLYLNNIAKQFAPDDEQKRKYNIALNQFRYDCLTYDMRWGKEEGRPFENVILNDIHRYFAENLLRQHFSSKWENSLVLPHGKSNSIDAIFETTNPEKLDDN